MDNFVQAMRNNLYSIGTNQADIARPFRRMNRYVRNLSPWIKPQTVEADEPFSRRPQACHFFR